MATFDQLTGWAGVRAGDASRTGRCGRPADPGAHEGAARPGGHPGGPAPHRTGRDTERGRAGPAHVPGPLYRLTEHAEPGDQAERSSFGVEPEAGAVYFVLPDGEAVFADSGVGVGLDVLHRYGSRVTASELLGEPEGPEEYLSEDEEERAVAESDRLAEELKEIDPAAFDGYEGFLWPGLLDRRLH
ncbi:SUKH-4 family immunity protein [Streptomyces zhihengii]